MVYKRREGKKGVVLEVKNILCKMQLAVEVIKSTICVRLCGILLKQTSQDCFVSLSLVVQGAFVL